LPIVTGPSTSSVAARIGSAAFFAPEMRTSPSSGLPPTICNLSRGVAPYGRPGAADSSGVSASIESACSSRPTTAPSAAYTSW